jgi:DNA-binding HxlR family transcriptional regulator
MTSRDAREYGMKRTSFADMDCSIARTLEVVGEWWTMLILREAFNGVRRFDGFQERLGIARNVLAARLQRLDHGLPERRLIRAAGALRVPPHG